MRRPLPYKVERARVKRGPFGTSASYGPNGVFILDGPLTRLVIIASNEYGWEHVSARPEREERTLTWEEMCFVKDLFWRDDEAVVQYHPPKSEYVNCHPFVLHLWRPLDVELPRPPAILVGPPPMEASR